MLFHSIDFIIFFPVVVFTYFLLPDKWKNIWLLVASYYFYMSWNAKYGLLLFGASMITYIGSLLVNHFCKKRGYQRAVLVIALLMVFGCLVYYKYTNFLVDSWDRVIMMLGGTLVVRRFDIVLPVGISFFSFQAAGYLIDVYRGDVEVEKNPIDYLLFVSFFPQLVAGPIERSRHLLRQMHCHQAFDRARVQRGLSIMLWGYFLKLVIADRCAVFVDHLFVSYEDHGFSILFLGAVMFSIQIYCDFMGYSTIARGAALVLGYELMDNFCQPYFATSIQEFWRRWHISLSTWFKDYVYIPLGGNRCSKLRHYFNLMITFLVSGLWHGADWSYVIWGGIHGALQVFGNFLRPFTDGICKGLHVNVESVGVRIFRILRTDFLVVLVWVFFRASNLWEAKAYLQQMFTGGLRITEWFDQTVYSFGLNEFQIRMLLCGVGILFLFSLMRERGIAVMQWLGKQHVVFRYAVHWVLVFMIALSFSLASQEFVYFQF